VRADPNLRLLDAATPQGAGTPPPPGLEVLLVPSHVAGPMCGRSEASWWRDHAAGRIPAPIKIGGRTLWRVEELRAWVEAGCPDRRTWEALRRQKGGGR
jgi:prophage regulatory protein